MYLLLDNGWIEQISDFRIWIRCHLIFLHFRPRIIHFQLGKEFNEALVRFDGSPDDDQHPWSRAQPPKSHHIEGYTMVEESIEFVDAQIPECARHPVKCDFCGIHIQRKIVTHTNIAQDEPVHHFCSDDCKDEWVYQQQKKKHIF